MGRQAIYMTEEDKRNAKREAQRLHRQKRRQILEDEGLMQTNFILDKDTREFLGKLKDEIGASNMSDVLRYMVLSVESSMKSNEEFHDRFVKKGQELLSK
jgi:hypothetical protein